jgi:hypothetical protein
MALTLLLACGSGEQAAPASANVAAGASSGGSDTMTNPVTTSGTDAGGSGAAAAGTSVTAGSSGGGAAGTTGGGAAAGSAGDSTGGGAFEAQCSAAATTDCEHCLCSSCGPQLMSCASTDGCQEILACIRDKGCTGIDCYCGTFDALACSAGQSDGPCKPVFLAAAGAHEPSLLNTSAGPASDAALAVGKCAQPGQPCNHACPM